MADKKKGVYTQNEILSQPETWQSTLEQLGHDWLGKLPKPRDYDHVIFTGCGSTYYLSIWAARLLQKELGISTQALPASELWYACPEWTAPFKRILLVTVSRSGETTETLHAIDEFQKIGRGDVVAITCYPESKLARKAPLTVTTPAGKEDSVTQTRSFSNMMLAVMLLIRGEIPSGLPKQLNESARIFLNENIEKAQQVGRDPGNTHFFFLGNGPFYGLANEVMLKMKEMSLSYSEAFHFMEFRHGPMSMVNAQSQIVGLMSPWAQEYELAVLKDMKKLGGVIIGVGGDIEQSSHYFDTYFTLPDEIPAFWRYPLYLPLLQMMAFERSLSKELNPDQPENLTAVVEL